MLIFTFLTAFCWSEHLNVDILSKKIFYCWRKKRKYTSVCVLWKGSSSRLIATCQGQKFKWWRKHCPGSLLPLLSVHYSPVWRIKKKHYCNDDNPILKLLWISQFKVIIRSVYLSLSITQTKALYQVLLTWRMLQVRVPGMLNMTGAFSIPYNTQVSV